MGSNNFTGPVIIDSVTYPTSYFGFGRTPGTDGVSTGPRYGTTSVDPNGVLSGPAGSLLVGTGAFAGTAWLNTDGAMAWSPLGGGSALAGRPFFETAASLAVTTYYVDPGAGSDTTGNGLTPGTAFQTPERAVREIPIEAKVERIIQLVASATAVTLPALIIAWNKITIQGATPTVAFSKAVTNLNASTVASQLNYTFDSDFAAADSSRGQLVQWAAGGALAGDYGVVIVNTGGGGGNTARITSGRDPFANAVVGNTLNFLTLNNFFNVTVDVAILACQGLVFALCEFTGANTAAITLYDTDVGVRACRIGPPGAPNATLRHFVLQGGSRLELGASTAASGTRTVGAVYYATRGTLSRGMLPILANAECILAEGCLLDGLNTNADTDEYIRIVGTLTQRGSQAIRQMASTSGVFSLFGGRISLNGTSRAVFFLNSGTVTGVLASLTLASGASFAQLPGFYGAVSGFPYAGGQFTGTVIFVDVTSTITSTSHVATASLNNSGLFTGPDTSGACIVGGYPAVGQYLDPGDGGGIAASASVSVSLVSGAVGETRSVPIPQFFGQELTLRFQTDGGGDIAVSFPSSFNAAGNSILTFSDAGEYAMFKAFDSGGNPRWQLVMTDGGVPS